MTNEEVYKKAIPLSKEELIEFLIEMNKDNNTLRNIILKYENFTSAGVEKLRYTSEHPYSGYKITVASDFQYMRDVS